MAWRNNTTGIYDPKAGIWRKSQGLKGSSDILGILPQTVRVVGIDTPVTFGNLLAVECKVPGKNLRPDQAEFIDNVRKRGGVALCVHTLRELEEGILPFLEP